MLRLRWELAAVGGALPRLFLVGAVVGPGSALFIESQAMSEFVARHSRGRSQRRCRRSHVRSIALVREACGVWLAAQKDWFEEFSIATSLNLRRTPMVSMWIRFFLSAPKVQIMQISNGVV